MAEPTDNSLERVGGRATGRVQGVGFRATPRASAQRHGVTGWVRNEPDGSVAFEAQGTRAALESVGSTAVTCRSDTVRYRDGIPPRSPRPITISARVRNAISGCRTS